MFFGGDSPGEEGTGDRGWGAEDDCSNCEIGHSRPVAYAGARYAVDKRLGGWGELGRKAGGGREHGGGELVGGLQEPHCYLRPLPPCEEISQEPEPALSPGGKARGKTSRGPEMSGTR